MLIHRYDYFIEEYTRSIKGSSKYFNICIVIYFVTDTKEWALETEQDETNVHIYGMCKIVDSFTTVCFLKCSLTIV